MKFAWDRNKAENNLVKHGISFEQAATAFDDPHGLVRLDVSHSAWEMRERLLGESSAGLLLVIFTVRKPGNIFRVISARPANVKERRHYEKCKRLFF